DKKWPWENAMKVHKGGKGYSIGCIFAMVLVLAGCTRFLGPREVRQLGRPDAPGYTIDEQQRRGRERLTVIEDDFRVGPKTYADRPSPTGR
ncbi:MAG: hypothetical protein NZU63_14885, partial [Gemmataceae bacterium]|nr:hypothetical protein [Gemmataceae bacterium]